MDPRRDTPLQDPLKRQTAYLRPIDISALSMISNIRDVPSLAIDKKKEEAKLRDDQIESGLDRLADTLDSFNWRDDAFTKIKVLLESDNVNDKGKGCQSMKEVLSASRDEIAVIAGSAIESGIIPLLCRFLDDPSAPTHHILTACFCLTNLLAGTYEQTALVVDCGIIPPLLNLLTCGDSKLMRQAMFALANIAGNTNRERKMLADNPLYWEKMKMALNCAPKSIEELGSWNLRNTCVLGGPPLQKMQIAVEYFMDLLKREVKNYDYGAGYTALRFGMETLASVAKTMEGRKALLNPNFQTPVQLLICARFCNDQLAREYCLETLWRLLEYPENHALGAEDEECSALIKLQIEHMIRYNAIYVINGIMKRTSVYSEEHRMYCCRVIMLIVLRCGNPYLMSCFCLNRSSLPAERTNVRSEEELHLDENWKQSPVYSEAKESMISGLELHYLKESGSHQDATGISGIDPSRMPMLGRDVNDSKCASLFETLFKIVYELNYKYEQWTREAAGRALLAIVAYAPPELIQKLIHPSVVNCIVEIAEQCQICELWMKEQWVVTEYEAASGLSKAVLKPSTSLETESDEPVRINHLTLQKLTYPEGVELAVNALERFCKIDSDVGFVVTMMNEPELRLLRRLRKLMFNTENYPKYAYYFNKESPFIDIARDDHVISELG